MHFALLSAEEAEPARLHQLDGWNIRPLFFPARDFKQIDGFLHNLARHCSSPERVRGNPKPLGRSSAPKSPQLEKEDGSQPPELVAAKHGPLLLPTVRINGFKVFYFRRNRKLGIKALARVAGLSHRELSRLEQVKIKSTPFGSHCFASCAPKTLETLEHALGCQGKLLAGQPDDFLTLYMLFYRQYRGTNSTPDANDSQLSFPFETKAVVFDFDGTLTAHNDDETTWEKIWVKLGYSINDCSDLHWKYSNGKFTHQRWCEITRDHFRNARFSRKDLGNVANSIRLIGGAREVLDSLRERGIKLYILSGSIRQIIDSALGDLRSRFDDVQANDMFFDHSGIIREIRGTPYDFEGKATYLSKVIEENGYAPYDVLFIGNSCNDIFASRSGARTLCVNPRGTESNNREHWTYLLRRMEHLGQIIEFVNL
jgi:HAD superfamily phosphoserine phosphatase-like hydrolase